MNDKQKRFVKEYLKDLNGKQAAIRAGYTAANAEVQASILLTYPKVRSAIEKGKEKLAKRADIAADDIIAEMKRLAFSDITKVIKWFTEKVTRVGPSGKTINMPIGQTILLLKDSEDIPPEVAACVKEIGQTKDGVRIKLYDKQRALEALGKHLGLFVEKHEHTGKDGKPIEVIAVDHKQVVKEAAKLIKAANNEENETFE